MLIVNFAASQLTACLASQLESRNRESTTSYGARKCDKTFLQLRRLHVFIKNTDENTSNIQGFKENEWIFVSKKSGRQFVAPFVL